MESRRVALCSQERDTLTRRIAMVSTTVPDSFSDVVTMVSTDGLPLADEMVSLVRDLRTARHARTARATPPVDSGMQHDEMLAMAAVTQRSLSMAAAAASTEPVPPKQVLAAERWLHVTGVDAPRSSAADLITPAVMQLRSEPPTSDTGVGIGGREVPRTPAACISSVHQASRSRAPMSRVVATPLASGLNRVRAAAASTSSALDGSTALGSSRGQPPPPRSPPHATSPTAAPSPPILSEYSGVAGAAEA